MKVFRSADILIPKNVDFTKWSVVACDQYTSEPEYWEKAEELVGDVPSALNLIFPEVYLSEGDGRIEKINKKMNEYLDNDIFEELKDSLIYVERTIKNGKVRRGIVGCIDLEEYDFNRGSNSVVRATEGTVLERIPPRVKIRENSPLEFPHVMILIDDEEKKTVEPLTEVKQELKKLYDFDLMADSGHLTGYLLRKQDCENVFSGIDMLYEEFDSKYDIKDAAKLIFAVGDGNHSLATAKTCWENLKKNLSEKERENHPARFALCEIVNLHDESLEFEPIHRVVFNVDTERLLKKMHEYYDISDTENGGQHIKYISEDKSGDLYVSNPSSGLAVGTLQNFLDEYIKEYGGTVDYIHGDDVVKKLGTQKGNIGFILPAMGKNELFKTVIKDGVLPRKTFSMGEACDKRFYLEGKKIK